VRLSFASESVSSFSYSASIRSSERTLLYTEVFNSGSTDASTTVPDTVAPITCAESSVDGIYAINIKKVSKCLTDFCAVFMTASLTFGMNLVPRHMIRKLNDCSSLVTPVIADVSNKIDPFRRFSGAAVNAKCVVVTIRNIAVVIDHKNEMRKRQSAVISQTPVHSRKSSETQKQIY
jgi:hypothetical protein